MEFQNLQHNEYKALRAKLERPESVVYCPRCGDRMIYKVKSRSEALGIIYNIECASGCFFYPIPPAVTPEAIKWKEPVERETEDAEID